jgi:predicted dehydrogenase
MSGDNNGRISRRDLLKASAFSLAGVYLMGTAEAAKKQSANNKLNIGVIGVANHAGYSLSNVAGENVVAICDVDDKYLAAAKKAHPGAATYTDFRRLLDRKDLDAVTVATPDHNHAIATIMALERGMHVYCEKPLTYSVEEARKVAELAKKNKRVTQMGTQIHAEPNYRRVVEVLKAGAIGPVSEVHCWAGTVWGGGAGRPSGDQPVPENLHWDTWLGPAQDRPYSPEYLPAEWRRFWEFGGGTLADMACHLMDLPYWALGIRTPETIEADGPPPDPERCPAWLVVKYGYPAMKNQPAVNLTWYSGNKRPRYFAEGVLPEWGNGVLFVGSRGMLLADYWKFVLLPEAKFAGYKPPKQSIPPSPGHHAEWIKAIKTGKKASCDFSYAGPLTEAVLLGNVAYRSQSKLEWDGRQMRIANNPEAERFLRRETYRKGWEI